MDVNGCLIRLIESLRERDVPFPLELKITPAELLSLFADDDLRPAGRARLGTACAALAAMLEAEGVPDPQHQPFSIGMIWLDLCRLADEPPPAAVEALLDMTAAWPLADAYGEADRVGPRLAGPCETATVPRKGGGRC